MPLNDHAPNIKKLDGDRYLPLYSTAAIGA